MRNPGELPSYSKLQHVFKRFGFYFQQHVYIQIYNICHVLVNIIKFRRRGCTAALNPIFRVTSGSFLYIIFGLLEALCP